MARWRTLHEIGVVAAVISRHGEEIALRYLAHQAIESKRGMNKCLSCYQELGYKPLPAREVAKITKAYDVAIATYGQDFDADYGWATLRLKRKRVTFADLEAEAGRAEMRSHYRVGNDNVHAGIKSIYVRLGLLDYDGLLAGRSNGGLMEPGQNAAQTLTLISVLVCMSEDRFDDLVMPRRCGPSEMRFHDPSFMRMKGSVETTKSINLPVKPQCPEMIRLTSFSKTKRCIGSVGEGMKSNFS
jgi:hypothetical protein